VADSYYFSSVSSDEEQARRQPQVRHHGEMLLLQAAPSDGQGTSVLAWLTAVATVIGVVAALQQLASYRRAQRRELAYGRLLDAIGDQIDADATRTQLEELRRTLARSRRAVEDEVPREARRLFLQTRREALAEQLGREFGELQEVEAELGLLDLAHGRGRPTRRSPHSSG
jgi:hypothetical protein